MKSLHQKDVVKLVVSCLAVLPRIFGVFQTAEQTTTHISLLLYSTHPPSATPSLETTVDLAINQTTNLLLHHLCSHISCQTITTAPLLSSYQPPSLPRSPRTTFRSSLYCPPTIPSLANTTEPQ